MKKKGAAEIEYIESRDIREKWNVKTLGIGTSAAHDIGQDKVSTLMPFQVKHIL